MAQRSPPVLITPNGKTIYLNNKELLAEVKRSKRKGEMSDKLARMLQMLTGRYAKKGNFVNYTYNEDMQAYAMMMLVRTWFAFNPEKSSNPFAFFTQCIKHSFIQYLNQEKRQRNIRDLVLIDQGLNPSFGFVVTNSDGNKGQGEDEEDYEVTYRIPELIKTAALDLPKDLLRDIQGPLPGDQVVDNTAESSDNEPLVKY